MFIMTKWTREVVNLMSRDDIIAALEESEISFNKRDSTATLAALLLKHAKEDEGDSGGGGAPLSQDLLLQMLENQRIQNEQMMEMFRTLSGNGFGFSGSGPGEGRTGNRLDSKVIAKPPPELDVDISLADFDSWEMIWNDYMKVSGGVNDSQEKQLSLFRGHLSLAMVSV